MFYIKAQHLSCKQLHAYVCTHGRFFTKALFAMHMQMPPEKGMLRPLAPITRPCAAFAQCVGVFSSALLGRSLNCALQLVTVSLLTWEVTNGYFTIKICPLALCCFTS